MHDPSLHLVTTRLRVALLLALASLPLQAALATPTLARPAAAASPATDDSTAADSTAADSTAVDSTATNSTADDTTTAAVKPPAKPRVAALGQVVVVGHRENLVGEAISASEGSIGQAEIAARPSNRTADLLEFIPGLVITQHSGSGKANQYFLRGFNLDHGTDFATFVDGMPVNMRTHAHGQGYSDLNFLIPETVGELTYRKGTYYADVGDFSSAGSVQLKLADTLPEGQALLTTGQYGYVRGLVLDSVKAGSGNLLYAAELQTYDGPWTDLSENVRKASGLLRYSAPAAGGTAHLTLMGYRNTWNSPDQIPQRAVDQGLIDPFGQLEPTDGGRSSRYSLSGGWNGPAFGGNLDASAYAIDYQLDLWSNFTYFLDNPVDGDQFKQEDRRQVYGFNLSQQWEQGRSRWRVGAEGRYDDIGKVALFHTVRRQITGTVRNDSVGEGSVGVFAANEFRFNDVLRSYVGVRYDAYRFKVDSSLAANSGTASAGKASYKASLIYHPIQVLDLYASVGTGFHSNDARGTTIRVDPNSGEPADPVTPLVGSKGAELGSRLYLGSKLQATLSLWTLKLDSELLFTGDGGTTEPSRPTKRDGVEFALSWFGSEHLSADVEASYSRAKFTDPDPLGSEVPGSIPLIVSADVLYKTDSGWLASARLRHFGAYPLIEDNSVRSKGSTLLNLRVGREVGRVGLFLDVLNVLDSRDHDVDYFFTSRLQGEPDTGVDDIHYHVFEPRSLRLSLRYAF